LRSSKSTSSAAGRTWTSRWPGFGKHGTFRELPLGGAGGLEPARAWTRIAAGSIDQLIESLPKTAAGKGKARQQWLIKPDPSRALDAEFLNFLDEARRELGLRPDQATTTARICSKATNSMKPSSASWTASCFCASAKPRY
jgi:hypothetical protein